jgi:pimeloyl-ACP methyl ester carboxylesterase
MGTSDNPTGPAATRAATRPSSWGDAELRTRFEQGRLAAFRDRGLAADAHRIPDSAGRETYALISGDSPCPTVLVHGGVGNTIEWADLAPRLGRPLVIPDRPGFGLSYPHDYRRVDLRADAARWLLELADGLHAEKIDLVANSMGGFFAIAFAAAHPTRVRRLVLSGAPVGVFSDFGTFFRLWATPGIGALISKIKIRDTDTLRKRVLGGYLEHPELLATDLLDVALAGINLPGTADTNRAILRAAATARGWRRDTRLNDTLAGLQLPTLFVWGDGDQLAPPDVGRAVVERMPQAQLAVISEAGHLPHLDQPAAVAATIKDFLRE